MCYFCGLTAQPDEGAMPTLAYDAVVNRLDPEVAAAVLSCVDVLVRLPEEDQRMVVAV